MNRRCITVLGGGAWGTALAAVVNRDGNESRLWARDASVVEKINSYSQNEKYLPGITLKPGIRVSLDPALVLSGSDLVLAAIPAQQLRRALGELKSHIPAGVPLVLCAKGIERDTGMLMSAVAAECVDGNPIAALSGPSFATDVARGLPTAVTVAADDGEQAYRLAQMLSSTRFRCYSSDDLIGVEIGGALKNVLAIAAGAVDGAGLGASAIAAMVTRGFVEIRRIGEAMDAKPETLFGLSGLGDLMLTCSSGQSRNYTYGVALGRGDDVSNFQLAEGAATAGIAAKLAVEKGIDAPIISVTARIIAGQMTISGAVRELFARPLKSENA